MPSLKIDTKTIKTLDVEIEEKVYAVPLGTELLPEELAKLNDDAASKKFFEDHIGKDVWNKLTVGNQRIIAQTWADETKKACGVEPGK